MAIREQARFAGAAFRLWLGSVAWGQSKRFGPAVARQSFMTEPTLTCPTCRFSPR
jgi:hypothetical protein